MNTSENVIFDEASHQYHYGKTRIPSVTQIIGEILGHQWTASEWYLQRGRAVHACAAFIAHGIDFEYDPRIEGQVQALRSFFKDVSPEVLNVELRLASRRYLFGGTLDLYCKIGGRLTVVDFKGSLDNERASFQVGAYSILIEENLKKQVNQGFGIEIRPDGRYRMSEGYEMRKARKEFLSLRTVYGIRERMNLLEGEKT